MTENQIGNATSNNTNNQQLHQSNIPNASSSSSNILNNNNNTATNQNNNIYIGQQIPNSLVQQQHQHQVFPKNLISDQPLGSVNITSHLLQQQQLHHHQQQQQQQHYTTSLYNNTNSSSTSTGGNNSINYTATANHQPHQHQFRIPTSQVPSTLLGVSHSALRSSQSLSIPNNYIIQTSPLSSSTHITPQLASPTLLHHHHQSHNNNNNNNTTMNEIDINSPSLHHLTSSGSNISNSITTSGGIPFGNLAFSNFGVSLHLSASNNQQQQQQQQGNQQGNNNNNMNIQQMINTQSSSPSTYIDDNSNAASPSSNNTTTTTTTTTNLQNQAHLSMSYENLFNNLFNQDPSKMDTHLLTSSNDGASSSSSISNNNNNNPNTTMVIVTPSSDISSPSPPPTHLLTMNQMSSPSQQMQQSPLPSPHHSSHHNNIINLTHQSPLSPNSSPHTMISSSSQANLSSNQNNNDINNNNNNNNNSLYPLNPNTITMVPKKLKRDFEQSFPKDEWDTYYPNGKTYSLLNSKFDLNGSYGFTVKRIDKNIQFSELDNAWILYRQNRFQIDCDLNGSIENWSNGEKNLPLYVNTEDKGLLEIDGLYFTLFVLKFPNAQATQVTSEPNEKVPIHQLGNSSGKKDGRLPVEPSPVVKGKANWSKLQFGSATSNNARVNPDLPNPNQQFFRIVVVLNAIVDKQTNNSNNNNSPFSKTTQFYQLQAKISPPMIVRGQNPGRFLNHDKSSKKDQSSSPGGKNNQNNNSNNNQSNNNQNNSGNGGSGGHQQNQNNSNGSGSNSSGSTNTSLSNFHDQSNLFTVPKPPTQNTPVGSIGNPLKLSSSSVSSTSGSSSSGNSSSGSVSSSAATSTSGSSSSSNSSSRENEPLNATWLGNNNNNHHHHSNHNNNTNNNGYYVLNSTPIMSTHQNDLVMTNNQPDNSNFIFQFNAAQQQQQQQQQPQQLISIQEPLTLKVNDTAPWNKSPLSEEIVYTIGKVGINTATPTQALSVNGNILVTGDLFKPSDKRIKSNIRKDKSNHWDKIDRLKIYDYDRKKMQGYDQNNGIPNQPVKEKGFLAQELKEVIPQAVSVAGEVKLQDGTTIPNLLVVNDRVLLLENIGATQQIGRTLKRDHEHIIEMDKEINKVKVESKREQHVVLTKMQDLVSFMLSEENKQANLDESCVYCSLMGLGPAWTLFVFGFFCPPFFLFGSFFLFSPSRVKWIGGLVNFITLIISTVSMLLVVFYQGGIATFIILPTFIGLGIILCIGIGFFRQRTWESKKRFYRERMKLMQKDGYQNLNDHINELRTQYGSSRHGTSTRNRNGPQSIDLTPISEMFNNSKDDSSVYSSSSSLHSAGSTLFSPEIDSFKSISMSNHKALQEIPLGKLVKDYGTNYGSRKSNQNKRKVNTTQMNSGINNINNIVNSLSQNQNVNSTAPTATATVTIPTSPTMSNNNNNNNNTRKTVTSTTTTTTTTTSMEEQV